MAFHNNLEERLAGIQRPKCTECKIPNCVAEEHRQQTDRYVEDVLRAIDTQASPPLQVQKEAKEKTPR